MTDSTPGISHLDLFSGIGGFALATEFAGLPISRRYFSELDPHGIAVYRKNYPDATPLGDVRGVDGNALREAHPGEWLVTAGFPCQDISTAGHRRGIAGARSGLWHEAARLIRDIRPRFVLLENVPNLTSKGFDVVLSDLADLGFDAEWQVLSARALGACHLRRRIWIAAYPGGDLVGRRVHRIHAEGGHLGDDPEPRNATPRPRLRFDWKAAATAGHFRNQPVIRRKDDGLPGWVDEWKARGKGLGNAIVPHVAADVLTRMYRGADS